MSRIQVIFVLAYVLTCTYVLVCGDRTNKKIYIDIEGTAYCFRRMNATHQTGCSSERGGNVGVLHYVNQTEEIDWLRDRGTHAPYAVLITPTMFTEENVKKLMELGKINSILVIFSNDTERPDYFSADSTCPNDRYGMYSDSAEYRDCQKTRWNPQATSFMFKDFGFPVVALTNETEVDVLISQCYEKFNMPGPDGEPRSYPLCSAQVKDEMDAAKDTPTCVRRSNMLQGLNQENYCDPLGDFNTFAFTRPITFEHPVVNNSIIVAAARLDGFSMFDSLYTNAEGTVSGIVTLLGAAYAIGKVKDTLNKDKPIMFAFFHGEAYDYIGSGRMVYDMEHGVFPTTQKEQGDKDAASPVSLDNIRSFIEVSQVGKPDSDAMWIHADPLSPATAQQEITKLVDTLKEASMATGLKLDQVPGKMPLPPASLQSFLKKIKIGGVVIADHKEAYTNKYYNSRYDQASVIGADYPENVPDNETYDYVTEAAHHLQKVASTVAKTLYTLSTGQADSSHVFVDNVTMANLLNCYLYRGNCELFQQIVEPDHTLKKNATTYYVGVSQPYYGKNNETEYTERLLAYFLGDKLNVTKKNCTDQEKADHTQEYYWMAGPKNLTDERPGFCVRSTANSSQARSPAFDIDGYDWSSNKYSSWTESQWQTDGMSLRVFLVPSRQREIAILVGGIGFAVLATGTTYFIKSRARALFNLTP